MIYMVFLVLALIVVFPLWADKSAKAYVVKGQGLVTAENKDNIMVKVSGAVKDINVEEGKEGKEGN